MAPHYPTWWNRGETGTVTFLGERLFHREIFCSPFWKISDPNSRLSSSRLPRVSSASKDFSDTKNSKQSVFFSPYLRPYSFASKNMFLFILFPFFSSSPPPMDSVRIQSLNPGEATCVGHPWCPGIWPQWYEEARCSWKQNRQHSCQVLFVTPEQRLNDAKNQSMEYRLVRLGPCKQNKLNRFNYSQWKVIQTTAAWANLKSLFVKEESLKFYYWSYVEGSYIHWGKTFYLLYLFFWFLEKTI